MGSIKIVLLNLHVQFAENCATQFGQFIRAEQNFDKVGSLTKYLASKG